MDIHRQKARVAMLSVISNSTLVLFKVIVGIFIGSVSVISEAIHSGVDLLAAVIALFAVKSSAKPADKEHPFGHGKMENLSGTIEALLIFLAAAWIIYEAVKKLVHPQPLDEPGWGIAVMFLSVVVNIVVSEMLFRVGKQTNSVALQADAWHLRTDVYTSLGVMVGLAMIWIGEKVLTNVHLHWLDPVAAIAVAILIIKAAYELTIHSARDLLDVSLPPDDENWIRSYLSNLGKTVSGFHGLRTRKAGSESFIEFHLMVDSSMTVEQSHQIADRIENDIHNHFTEAKVTIHVEPCNGYCTPECSKDCLLSEEERKAIEKKKPI
jgi:cation diffusion facilitator family transporter